jgi:hypothetical protein
VKIYESEKYEITPRTEPHGKFRGDGFCGSVLRFVFHNGGAVRRAENFVYD